MSALSKRPRAAAVLLLWILSFCARVHVVLAADGDCDVARVSPFSHHIVLRSLEPQTALLRAAGLTSV